MQDLERGGDPPCSRTIRDGRCPTTVSGFGTAPSGSPRQAAVPARPARDGGAGDTGQETLVSNRPDFGGRTWAVRVATGARPGGAGTVTRIRPARSGGYGQPGQPGSRWLRRPARSGSTAAPWAVRPDSGQPGGYGAPGGPGGPGQPFGQGGPGAPTAALPTAAGTPVATHGPGGGGNRNKLIAGVIGGLVVIAAAIVVAVLACSPAVARRQAEAAGRADPSAGGAASACRPARPRARARRSQPQLLAERGRTRHRQVRLLDEQRQADRQLHPDRDHLPHRRWRVRHLVVGPGHRRHHLHRQRPVGLQRVSTTAHRRHRAEREGRDGQPDLHAVADPQRGTDFA